MSTTYSVEQVLLFEKESGLLLQHVASRGSEFRDPDLVAGMFAALQTFVVDNSFSGNGGFLDSIQVGDVRIRIASGPKAVLVAVISGQAPSEFGTVLQDIVDQIHNELARELDAFQGAALDAARPYLELCLLGRAAER